MRTRPDNTPSPSIQRPFTSSSTPRPPHHPHRSRDKATQPPTPTFLTAFGTTHHTNRSPTRPIARSPQFATRQPAQRPPASAATMSDHVSNKQQGDWVLELEQSWPYDWVDFGEMEGLEGDDW